MKYQTGYDTLFNIGVTRMTEQWHGPLELELIFMGDFTDEDIANWLYCNTPVIYTLRGEVAKTINTQWGTFTAWFTRGSEDENIGLWEVK